MENSKNGFWGEQVNGLRIACVAEKQIFRLDEKIELFILIDNLNSEDAQLEELYPYLSYDVEIMYEDGGEIQMTEMAKNVRSSSYQRIERGSTITVKKGKPYIRSYPIDEYFILNRVGDYKITISRNDWEHDAKKLVSIALEIRVF